MADENVLKPKSFRINEETAEKFKEIASKFSNQQEALSKLIETYEFQSGKAILVNRTDDINNFENYVTCITRMYMSALEEYQNSKEIVRAEYEAQLTSKDEIICDLQQKLKMAENKMAESCKASEALQKENNALSNELITIKNDYEEKFSNTKNMLEDKENLNKALTSSCNDLKDKIHEIEKSIEQLPLLQNENKNLSTQILSITAERDALKEELENNKKHFDDILNLRQEQTLVQQEKALLEQNAAHSKELESVRREYNIEIERYQKKYFDLVDTIKNKGNE